MLRKLYLGKGDKKMLNTWRWGYIEIVNSTEITIFDTYIDDDILGEWSYYQTTDGEIVAVHNWED